MRFSDDRDIRAYQLTREKFKKQKQKTNVEIMEAFNETAKKFLPLYQKRLNQ